jgi:hypothetical protein
MPKNPIYSEIIRARERMVQLGFTVAHDDSFERGELVLAGLAYALFDPNAGDQDGDWPFPEVPFTPHETRRDNLIAAAAFIIAEIERGDREHHRAQEGEDWKRADG